MARTSSSAWSLAGVAAGSGVGRHRRHGALDGVGADRLAGAVVGIGAVGEAAQRRGGAELQGFAGEVAAALGAEQQRGDGAGGDAARHAAAEAAGKAPVTPPSMPRARSIRSGAPPCWCCCCGCRAGRHLVGALAEGAVAALSRRCRRTSMSKIRVASIIAGVSLAIALCPLRRARRSWRKAALPKFGSARNRRAVRSEPSAWRG